MWFALACSVEAPPSGRAPDADPAETGAPDGGIARIVAGRVGAAGMSSDGLPATDTWLYAPQDAWPMPDGSFWIADYNNNVIREVDPDGISHVRAGNGFPSGGTGGPALEEPIKFPSMVLPDPEVEGVMWLALHGLHEIGRLEDGWLEILYGAPLPGYAGDGGPVAFARFAYPSSIAFDGDGALYVSDRLNQVIRRVSGGVVDTIAGSPGVAGYAGDGGPAALALLSSPDEKFDPGSRLDVRGTRLVFADTGNDVVREIDLATGIIDTLATGFAEPHDVAIASDGTVFVADTGNACVVAIDPDGAARVVAGVEGEPGPPEDGLPPLETHLGTPTAVALGPDGDLWIADPLHHVIVRVTAP